MVSHPESLSRLDPVLVKHLTCPLTRKPLDYDRQRQALISTEAGLVFPIRHNVPLMLEELAVSLESWNANEESDLTP